MLVITLSRYLMSGNIGSKENNKIQSTIVHHKFLPAARKVVTRYIMGSNFKQVVTNWDKSLASYVTDLKSPKFIRHGLN